MNEPEKLIPPHGGYRKLKSFQVAQLAYDVTVRFCDRYIEQRSRTHDQMVQAARSGVQNIAEGSQASGTSKKTELKLTNVARASLEELRLDYEDFLRQRGLAQWAREDARRAELIAHGPPRRMTWRHGRGLCMMDRMDGMDSMDEANAGQRVHQVHSVHQVHLCGNLGQRRTGAARGGVQPAGPPIAARKKPLWKKAVSRNGSTASAARGKNRLGQPLSHPVR